MTLDDEARRALEWEDDELLRRLERGRPADVERSSPLQAIREIELEVRGTWVARWQTLPSHGGFTGSLKSATTGTAIAVWVEDPVGA